MINSPFIQLLTLVLLFVIMYFLLFRPRQKKVKEHRNMVGPLHRDDQVVTQGKVTGKVPRVKEGDNEIEVETADGTRVRVVTTTTVQVLNKTESVK